MTTLRHRCFEAIRDGRATGIAALAVLLGIKRKQACDAVARLAKLGVITRAPGDTRCTVSYRAVPGAKVAPYGRKQPGRPAKAGSVRRKVYVPAPDATERRTELEKCWPSVARPAADSKFRVIG